MSKLPAAAKQLVICIKAAALEKRKQIRVIDESGEDYLYPKTFFIAVTLPQSAHKAVLVAA